VLYGSFRLKDSQRDLKPGAHSVWNLEPVEGQLGGTADSDTFERDEVFESFIRKRKSLNEGLDQSRKALDLWFERQPLPAPMHALANLEVILKTRRDLLAKLVILDDEFMLHLIQMRAQGSQ
jgi:hypothetical protein